MNFFKSYTKKSAATNNNNGDELEPAMIRKALFDQISASDYNKHDIDLLKKDDFAISRYCKEDQQSTIDTIKTVLEWRKSYNLSDLKDDDFPEEFHKSEAFRVHGKDVEGNAMVYIRVQHFKKNQYPIDDVRKYLSFMFDRVDRETKGEGWALCFDCTNAGLSNVDMDLLKFVVTALTTYFVENCQYALIYDMPWILASVWKLVKSWLPAEQREAVKFANKKELSSFIKDEQLPEFFSDYNKWTS